MPTAIRIIHITRYRYKRAVSFGNHRLLLRPRDGHDLRLIQSAISITPTAQLRWHFDTFGNSVAIAKFSEPSNQLEIRSELLVRRFSRDDFLVSVDRQRIRYPFQYSSDVLTDLAHFIALENVNEAPELARWLETVFQKRPDEVLVFLQHLSETIHANLTYVRREQVGTQTALTTIKLKSGSCRDFAFLFMECARCFGFAARFVTGYLNDQSENGNAPQGGGATHAWTEIYLPEEGWIEFDPTNQILAGSALIRVAVTRTPLQATPILGSYNDETGDSFIGMDVEVDVRSEQYDPGQYP